MALIKCPECGNEISDTAKVCVKCGFQIEEHKLQMEKEKQKSLKQAKEKREEEKHANRKCPECGKVVGNVVVCPHCGFNIERYNNDKQGKILMAICIIVILLFIVWLFGGSETEKKESAVDKYFNGEELNEQEREEVEDFFEWMDENY